MTAITQPQPGSTGLRRYADVLRTPGALQFAIPGVIGRMPMGMLSIAQVMLIVSVTGRYGTAGIVSAAGAILFAIVTPRLARLADRYGQATVLRPLALVFAVTSAAFIASAISHAPDWLLIVTGALCRAAMPALGPMVRSRWSQLLGGSDALDSAFSLEGIADEVIFIAAPVLVVALVTEVQPVSGMLVTVLLGVAGVAGLTRHRRSEPATRSVSRASGTVLRNAGLRVLIGVHVFLGALFAAVDIATIAFAQEHGASGLAGPLLALYGLGSAIAGVWYGARHWRISPARQAARRPGGYRARRRPAGDHAGAGRHGDRDLRGRARHLRHPGQLLQHRGADRARRPAHRGHVLADHRRQHRNRDRLVAGLAGWSTRTAPAPGSCSRWPRA